MIKRFENKAVLITGASRGIGKGLAERFASEGANRVLASNEKLVHSVAEELKAAGSNVMSALCDVTNKSEVGSKFGVIGITQSLAKELAPYNITVNAFCPGRINSEQADSSSKRRKTAMMEYSYPLEN